MHVRIRLIFCVAALFAVAGLGCDGCQDEPPEEPPTVEPDVGVEREDEPEDPLEEARENAEELGVEYAVTVGDVSRNVAANIEANASKPSKPAVRKPRVAEAEGGTIEPSAVQKVFRTNDSAFKKCYERSLKKNPGLEGKVRLSILISGNGSVGSASVKGISMSDGLVNECMKRQALTMKFPEPTGGSVRVNKSYTFTPDF